MDIHHLALAGLPILMLMTFLTGILATRLLRRKELLRLASLACPACGVPLGIEALSAAQEKGRRLALERKEGAEGLRLRMLLTLEISCPGCEAKIRCENGRLSLLKSTGSPR